MKMKVKGVSSTNKHDWRCHYHIEVNGKSKASFTDGEPEDANMGRDFNDIFSIIGLMRMAYEAGKNGEDFEYESEILEWGEW